MLKKAVDLALSNPGNGQRREVVLREERGPVRFITIGRLPSHDLTPDKDLVDVEGKWRLVRVFAPVVDGEQLRRRHLESRLLVHLPCDRLTRGFTRIGPAAG